MLRLGNLKIVWKILLPAAILALVSFVIAWKALSGLLSISAIASHTLEKNARLIFLANDAAFKVSNTTSNDRGVVLAEAGRLRSLLQQRAKPTPAEPARAKPNGSSIPAPHAIQHINGANALALNAQPAAAEHG